MILINTHSIEIINQTMSAVTGIAPDTNTLQGNALAMGFIYGVIHVIGPDHLGTLMTLSAGMTPQNAFKTGGAWGLGHSFGMVLVAAAFVLVHRIVPVSVESWEHWGDYIIGVSLILCALYFMFRESAFLEQKKDGSFVAVPCACHGHPPALAGAPAQVHRRPRNERRAKNSSCCDKPDANHGKFCGNYCQQDSCSSAEEGCDAHEHIPLVPSVPETVASTQELSRDSKGALLGVIQGFCCPMGMLGVTFLATLSTVGVISFLFTFLFVSAFGTASVAAAWASLTNRGIGVSLSPRTVYRASCCFTLILGVVWITANYYGFLDKLNYAEHLHAT